VHQVARVGLRLAGVHDGRQSELAGECELIGESGALDGSWRVVVVVVEATLAHRDRPDLSHTTDAGEVTRLLEVRRVVRVDAGGEPDVVRVRVRERPGPRGGGE
jgi:hypothetical protein